MSFPLFLTNGLIRLYQGIHVAVKEHFWIGGMWIYCRLISWVWMWIHHQSNVGSHGEVIVPLIKLLCTHGTVWFSQSLVKCAGKAVNCKLRNTLRRKGYDTCNGWLSFKVGFCDVGLLNWSIFNVLPIFSIFYTDDYRSSHSGWHFWYCTVTPSLWRVQHVLTMLFFWARKKFHFIKEMLQTGILKLEELLYKM